MTDNVKHSTSYFHEVVAKSFEMFKNGYEPVMETPFQPRRQGSAFVVEYKLVREPLDDLTAQLVDHMKLAAQPNAKFSGEVVELKDESGKVIRVPGIVIADKIEGELHITEIENASDILDNPPAPNRKLQSVLEEGSQVFKELVENTYDENLNELADQAQKLNMGYDKQLTIQEKWEIDDNLEHDAIGEATGAEPYIDPLDIENAEKELAESYSCGKMVYTKEELDAMHWDQLKPLLDEAGIKGRRRQNLIRDFLKKQEKENEL